MGELGTVEFALMCADGKVRTPPVETREIAAQIMADFELDRRYCLKCVALFKRADSAGGFSAKVRHRIVRRTVTAWEVVADDTADARSSGVEKP